MKNRTVLYIRTINDLDSLQEQLELTWKKAEAQAYHVTDVYYQIADNSAHVHHHTPFHLLEQLEKHKIDTVIFNNLDDISDDDSLMHLVIDRLNSMGVEIMPANNLKRKLNKEEDK